MSSRRVFVHLLLIIALQLAIASAQNRTAVLFTHTGSSAVVDTKSGGVDFGPVNVCPSGQSGPVPCSESLTLNYIVGSTTTFGPINVTTQGTPSLDFTLGAGSTCVGTVSAGNSCTVNVTFAPIAPGVRMGAVQLFDNSGNLLTTTVVSGTGEGPAITFQPNTMIAVFGGLGATGVAVDAAGNVFVADEGGRRKHRQTPSEVVKVTPSGAESNLGTGLNRPTGVAVDGAGDVFIADQYNNRVVEVPAIGGAQTTVGTGLSYPSGVAVDGAGDVFIVDAGNNRVVEVLAAGGGQTIVPAVGLNLPQGVAVDGAGDVFIADTKNNRVVEITPSGVQTTVGTGLSQPFSVAVDAAGNVFIADTLNSQVVEVPAGGGAQITVAQGFSHDVTGVAVDGAGDVFIVDKGNGVVWNVQRPLPPTTFTFANTLVGSTSSDSPKSVIIQNVGNQTLDAVPPGLVVGSNFLQVGGSGAPVDCTSSFALVPGAQCNVSISFEPQTDGNLTSAATFSDDTFNTIPSASQSFALQGRAGVSNQTITFTVPAPSIAADGHSFTVAATASSGLPVSFGSSGGCYNSGATFTMKYVKHYSHEGCTVTAIQEGNDYYLPAPNALEYTAITAPLAQTVTFTGSPAHAPYLSTFTVVATSNTGLTATITAAGSCAISGTTVTMTSGHGRCELTAKWPANYLYNAAVAFQTTYAQKISSGLDWATPAPITYGTALSATQLDATANVAGAFVYSPGAGTVPKVPKPPKTCDTLKVTFTPTLKEDYEKETASVCLVVNPN